LGNCIIGYVILKLYCFSSTFSKEKRFDFLDLKFLTVTHGDKELFMKIQKSPYSQIKKPKQGQNFSWKSKKDFQIMTFKTRKKDQQRRNELK
jgi:hypothetical protein